VADILELMMRYAPNDGAHSGPWPGLTFIRSSQRVARGGVIYKQCLCFVAQGRKRAYLGERVYRYDPMHYLVLSVPLPLETEIVEASPEKPFLAMSLEIDAKAVSDLLLDVGELSSTNGSARRGIEAAPMDPEVRDALARYLRALSDPLERRILAPSALRELLFRVYTGSQGELLRTLALRDGATQNVSRVVRYLDAHFAQPLDIKTIAREAGMSASTLHHTFKAVTSFSPIQYVKKIRLHRARALLLQEGLNVGEAGYRVGYQSASQFSRERVFGASPAREVMNLRERLRAADRPARRSSFPDTRRRSMMADG